MLLVIAMAAACGRDGYYFAVMVAASDDSCYFGCDGCLYEQFDSLPWAGLRHGA